MAARIYTRSGDGGETGLFGGNRVAKDDVRLDACGAVDELNASIGAAKALAPDPQIDAVLERVQHDLFQLGSDLATPLEHGETSGKITIRRVEASSITRIENFIDGAEQELPELRQFILPGGHPKAAALHLCRTVCRRAERRCVSLARSSEPDSACNAEVIRYLNRLSDLLFVLARSSNQRNGIADVNWNLEV